ncbi:ubiquinol-cytochrome c reductase iron-sulfur subunit [Parasedimentitalea maritima]|uniref:Ubiquinol-cytochrome c reductase iron-sulfur subunit n=1 Tax=Parasedimentitalea maritima TaxID=2578117 RepID=A0ABY2V0E9_9RHOB|nr:ubiquinol-cytochrome c reductase iron-sulfur subunit [Zongyanglinia marina]TLP67709.1 ubiquinol-cytochrome c reductase iron-sulfur subunit [Zongyanglinia marina]
MIPDDKTGTTSQPSRRDFLTMATCGMGAVTVGAGIWGLGRTLAPSAEIVAAPELQIDLSEVPVGEYRTLRFDRKLIFLKHLTKEQVTIDATYDVGKLPDGLAQNANMVEGSPASFENRTVSFNGVFTVLWGKCPRGFCVPLADAGDYGGWFCLCGGAHFDAVGRVRRGSSPWNMRIPRHRVSKHGILTVTSDQGGLSQEELDRLVFGSRS